MEKDFNTWAIQYNKEDINKALKNVAKNSESNILYLNCRCKFKIGNVRVRNRTFDSCFFSEESGVVVLFARGVVSEEEIEKYLNENKVKYTVVRFKELENKEYKDDETFPEVVFVKEKYILKAILSKSVRNGEKECAYFPKESSTLYLNYIGNDGERYAVQGNISEGLIVLKNKLVLLPNNPKFHDLGELEVRDLLQQTGIAIKENKIR